MNVNRKFEERMTVENDQGHTIEESSTLRHPVEKLSSDYKLISRLMTKLDEEVASFTCAMEKVNNDCTEIVGLTKLWDEQAQIIEHQVAVKQFDANVNSELHSKEQPINFTIQSVDDKAVHFQDNTDELNFI
jgi:hypothetical protein